MSAEPTLWRVDVAGVPVYVSGKPACEHLQIVNSDLARMKMALYRILRMNPDEWGKQGIFKAQSIAQEGLK